MNKIIPAEASVILRDVLPAVNGNATQLKNLFTQLIYNSIIFKKENHPLQVQITACQTSDEEKKSFY
jgi:light-regulated signal transduction histidine kinase (bacteriophytochrome)